MRYEKDISWDMQKYASDQARKDRYQINTLKREND